MSVRESSRDELLYLLCAPHALQWQKISEAQQIDDEVSAALSSLPTLTELDTYRCRSVSFLSSLPRLRYLFLDMDSDVHVAADIVARLSRCSQLTHLYLNAADVTAQQLRQLLPHLPQLCAFGLMCCSALNSLSFLSECGHLSHSLQSLTLWGSYPPAALSTELEHVLTLTHLTHLTIIQFSVAPLERRW